MAAAFWTFLLLTVGLAAADLAEDAEKYLLPWNIRPEHYDLTLYTHIERFQIDDEQTFEFMGIAEINFLVLYGDLSEVVLHTFDETSIVSAQIIGLDEDPATHDVTVDSYDPETNKQTFKVSPPLQNNGRYRITIYYIGLNHKELRGFYRSSYQDNQNVTKWLLTTHFESFGARQAFPCFDEPEYKATFKLTVHYNETLANEGYKAFFNTEIESEEIRNGIHITTFKTTPRPLSTYLVAFIVAPFSISPELAYFNSSFNGENPIKPLRTIGQPKYFSPQRQDLLSQVAGPAALNTMTKLTGVGFGMDKAEQAGIPDFGPGAMENWGLVTYRETAVFFNNETGTTGQKQSVTSTSVHELAHQWFGDLVTLHWWTDVWLNEGFATYFATHAANEFREPDLDTTDWNLIGQFVTGTLQRSALKTDGRPTSRPLTAEAYLPDTIDSYFDGISYDKGGSVLRMWMHTLGPEIFYAGLNRYLRQQEENVGTPEILLASWDGVIDALAEPPELPGLVAELFQNWHLQAGYPVLSASREGSTLTVSQERFLSSPGNDSSRWNVPLTYSTDMEPNFNNTTPIGFLLSSDDSTTLQLRNEAASWVVLNNQATGYYRINYDDDNWEKLIAVVNDEENAGQIQEFNRAQILDDAANLAASTHKKYLSYATLFDLMRSLRHERSLIVWTPALRAMEFLMSRLRDNSAIYPLLKDYFSSLVEPTFNELSLYVAVSDSHTQKLLRSEIAQIACRLDIASCKKQAQDLFMAGSAHPDVRAAVACSAVKQGGNYVWEEVLEDALSEDDLLVKGDLLSALTCTSDVKLLERLLELLEDRSTFINCGQTVLASLQTNNPDLSLIGVEKDIKKLYRNFEKVEWNRLVKLVLRTSSPQNGGIQMELRTSEIEAIKEKQVWFEQNSEDIHHWLSNRY